MSWRRDASGFTAEERVTIDNLKRDGIKIGVDLRPPFAYPCYEEFSRNQDACLETRGPGFGIEFTQTLCDRMRFQCTFVPANFTRDEVAPGQLQASWLRKIQDNEFDTTLPWLYQLPQTRQLMNFTMPVFYMEAGVLVRTQFTYSTNFWFLLEPFRAHVWLTLLLSLIVVALWDGLIKLLYDRWVYGERPYPEGRPEWLSRCLRFLHYAERSGLEQIGLLLQRGMEVKTLQSSRRMVLAAVGWASICLVASYGGYLVSSQVAATIDLPFSDVRSLAAAITSKQYKLLMLYSNGFILDQLGKEKDKDTAASSALAEALKMNPPDTVYAAELGDIVDRITKSTQVNLAFWSSLYTLKAIAKGNCNVTIIPLSFVDFGTYAFRRGTKSADVFTKLILNFKDKGYFLERLEMKYSYGRTCELMRKPNREETHEVHLDSLSTVIICFFVGLTIACCSLFVEMFVGNAKRTIAYFVGSFTNVHAALGVGVAPVNVPRKPSAAEQKAKKEERRRQRHLEAGKFPVAGEPKKPTIAVRNDGTNGKNFMSTLNVDTFQLQRLDFRLSPAPRQARAPKSVSVAI